MALIYFEGDTQAREDLAKEICMTLWQVYPGHDWSVRVMEGMCHIRLPLLGNGQWGMAKKFNKMDHDAAVFKRMLIMAAGELLERANIFRGRADEDQPEVAIEGVPLKDQPAKYKPPVEFTETVHDSDNSGIRTEVRPQVERVLNS